MELRAAINGWAARQEDQAAARSEAMRRLVEQALASQAKKR
jgi:hypothetical protein